jgi:hypothetical protein
MVFVLSSVIAITVSAFGAVRSVLPKAERRAGMLVRGDGLAGGIAADVLSRLAREFMSFDEREAGAVIDRLLNLVDAALSLNESHSPEVARLQGRLTGSLARSSAISLSRPIESRRRTTFRFAMCIRRSQRKGLRSAAG